MTDFELRRMAERYANEPDFKEKVDEALGVFHVPLCPEGDCAGCDAHRMRSSLEEPEPEAQAHRAELSAFIEEKGLADEYTRWARKRRG